MVHLFNKQALSIRPVAGHMNRKILATARLQGVVPSHASFEDDGRSVTFVSLPGEVLSGGKLANVVGKLSQRGNIAVVQRRVLFQLLYQGIAGSHHKLTPASPSGSLSNDKAVGLEFSRILDLSFAGRLMAYYKIYKIDGRGHILGPPVEYEGVHDEDALTEARKIAGGDGVEVWESDRRVTLITAPTSRICSKRGT